MINGPLPDESAFAMARLTSDTVDMALHRLSEAIDGHGRARGATVVRRLRALVDGCVPARPNDAARFGELPAILGTAVALQYPLMELERYLTGEPCDIADRERAAVYLSFVRHHLWRLEQLIRQSVDARV
jgi:hypothetical protein